MRINFIKGNLMTPLKIKTLKHKINYVNNELSCTVNIGFKKEEGETKEKN